MAIRILDSLGRRVTLADWQRGVRDVTVLDAKRVGAFEVRAVDLGGGQFEASAVRQSVAEEYHWNPIAIESYLECVERNMEETADERAEASAKRAAQRARKRIRHLCKANGADTLLTLTYRANETDLARVKRDLKDFDRRMRKLLPEFGFIAAFEEQKRGAWHIHAAIRKLPRVFVHRDVDKKTGRPLQARVKSFDALRAVWRAVTKERGGNVDVSSPKGARSAGKIAGYIAKYATKAFADGEKWSNRWTKYGFADVKPAMVLGVASTLLEAVGTVYGFMSAAHEVLTARLDRWGEWFYLASEVPAKGSLRPAPVC